MDKAPDLSVVEPFLRDLGRYQLEGYRKLEASDLRIKEGALESESVVTEYDVESERRMSRFIEKHFPGDSFLGEELGNLRRDPDHYWILDPIDGTTNFTQGIAYWGPTLARVVGGEIEAGWIYLPALDEMFHGRKGRGASRNGRGIRSSHATRYCELTTVATTSLLHREYRLIVPAKQRILGSLVANLAYLACGTFAAVYCRGHVWDLAAGILIAREAGAIVECRPGLGNLDMKGIERGRAESHTVFGRGNEHLPSLQGFLVKGPDS